MVASLRWFLALVLVLSLGVLVGPSAEPVDKKPAPAKPLDPFKLPADAIFVVIDKPGELLNLLPRFVVTTPEKFKEMQDELARLREKAPKETPVRPSSLKLKGHVVGDRVLLQAEFVFSTDKPRTTVSLGCKPAQANNARLVLLPEGDANTTDEPFTDLRTDADGFSIFLNEARPKGCKLTLDLTLSLTGQGNAARSFELKLPQAAQTALERFTLPPGARDVALADTALVTSEHDGVTALLGAADKFTLSWKPGKSGVGVGPTFLEASSTIHVRLDEQRAVNTTADLTLTVRGSTNRWELLVPPGATVTVNAPDDMRVARKDVADQKFASLQTIHLKEASGDPLHVTVNVPARKPQGGNAGRVPVGPFIVRGAIRQPGTILVSSSGAEPRLFPHGDTTARDATKEEKEKNATSFLRAFSYQQVPYQQIPQPPQPPQPTTAVGPASYSLLDLEPEAVRGLVETRTTHTLKMETERGTNRKTWNVFMQLDAKLVNQGTVDQIEIDVPKGVTFVKADTRPVPPIAEVRIEDGKAILKLTGEAWKSFQSPLTLQFRYDADAGDKGTAVFEFPRVHEPAAGSRTEVLVKAPEDMELWQPERAGVPAFRVFSPFELRWAPEPGSLEAERPPEAIEVAWKPFRPEVRATADVTLTAPKRQAQVRHELVYRYPPGTQPLPATIALPAGVLASTFQVVSGGDLVAGEGNAQLRHVKLNKLTKQEAVLVLEYAFLLEPEKPEADTYAVPLIVPEQTNGETKVRVWSEPGTLPEPMRADADWSRHNVEKVKKRSRLPVLVLQAQSMNAKLTLRLAEAEGDKVNVLADRALIRVDVKEEGHAYHASFLLTQLLTRQLDLELPAPVPSLGLVVKLGDQIIDPAIVDEQGQPSASGRIARLTLNPELVNRSVLDVKYKMPPGRLSAGLFQTVLQPPVLRGEPGRVLIRWQVTLPPGVVPLGPEGGAGTPRVWSRKGWLLVPRLGVSGGDMDRWFAGNENLQSGEELDAGSIPSLICLRSGLEPLVVTHAPFKPWLGCCSLAVLLIGLGLYFLARRAGQGAPGWFWICVTLLTFGIGALWLFRPTALAALAYGAEVGAAVLLIFGLLLATMHRHQRRQVAFLPSFRRGRGGSSLIRSGVATPPQGSGTGPKPAHGEPSTVDAPRPAASNHV